MKHALYLFALAFCACSPSNKNAGSEAGQDNNIKLVTLAPGHFHAALVQKEALEGVDSTVYVYAPAGQDLAAHLQRIESFNTRAENPTHWSEEVYEGNDYLQKMLSEKRGNVVILAGNNRDKTDYILQSVSAGLNVLADKPMAIDKASFAKLEEAFRVAAQKNVKLYDIMTERYDVWTEIQRRLMQNPELFGELVDGSEKEPAVTVSSTHHFYKVVAGSPLIRPVWYYDVKQQGEGIVDVTTHLIDLIHWKCFPEQVVDYKTDINLLAAKHWPTTLTKEQFALSTGAADFPDFLMPCVKDSVLNVYANGSMLYQAKGKYIDLSVIWNFQAPEGTGDTHVCIIRGTNGTISILQGAEQGFVPKLYVEAGKKADKAAYRKALDQAVADLQTDYPGVTLHAEGGRLEIVVPKELQSGHEKHFSSVIRKYIGYLNRGDMPAWEVPNMLTKYYLTTSAVEKALSGN